MIVLKAAQVRLLKMILPVLLGQVWLIKNYKQPNNNPKQSGFGEQLEW